VCAGFCTDAVVPSPKSHDHDVGDPDEVSVNCTASGACPPVTDELNDADGTATPGGAAVTVIVTRAGALLPAALAALNATV
jgi:hypothetical protein